PASPGAAALAPFHYLWRFDRGPSSDLAAPVGEWKWKAGDANNPGVMQVPDIAGVELPRVSAQPFVVTITCRPTANQFKCGAEWTDIHPKRLWFTPLNDAPAGRYVRRVYFLGRYMIHSLDMPHKVGAIDLIDDYATAFPTDQVNLVLQHV